MHHLYQWIRSSPGKKKTTQWMLYIPNRFLVYLHWIGMCSITQTRQRWRQKKCLSLRATSFKGYIWNMYASQRCGKAVPSEEKCGLPFSGWPSIPRFFANCDITTTAFATTESTTLTTSSTAITMTLKLQLSKLLGNKSSASWCKGNQRKSLWCWNEIPFIPNSLI